jgi:biopolymer transport protein ExbD
MTEQASLALKRPRPAKALISLIPMIDVLLILLVFFMVTSTYLDLDLIPAVSQQEDQAGNAPAPVSAPLLIRLGESGMPVIRGQDMTLEALDQMLRGRLRTTPNLSIVILPTGVARMQSLISVMDVATSAGVTQVRVIRLEGRP